MDSFQNRFNSNQQTSSTAFRRALEAKEEENLVKKTNLCEKVEAINAKKIQTISEWEKITEEVTNIQKSGKQLVLHHKK